MTKETDKKIPELKFAFPAVFSGILRSLCDEDGTYIIGDYKTIVYGDGETLLEALRDYIISLIEYIELLRKSQSVREKLTLAQFSDEQIHSEEFRRRYKWEACDQVQPGSQSQ